MTKNPVRGTRCHHPLLLMVVSRGIESKSKKFSCNVVRGVKGAVIRNRLKRRLREIYRHHQGSLLSEASLLVMGKPPAVKATFVELEEAFVSTARRASVLKYSQEGQKSQGSQ